jgi:hypothetical protein
MPKSSTGADAESLLFVKFFAIATFYEFRNVLAFFMGGPFQM